MTHGDLSTAKNPDLRGSLAAMRRAARAARELALQTDTALIRFQDGKVVRIESEQLRAEMAAMDTVDVDTGATR